jgi:glycosyltransferase involved in cell wall biosynthesis
MRCCSEVTSERPTLSVVVASYNSLGTLEDCLESLRGQLNGNAEIVVADCSTEDVGARLGARFPEVQFLHFDRRLTIPELRREALRMTRGEVVAMTEGRMVPSPGWTGALLKSHLRQAQSPAVGGPIDCEGASAFDTAVFFCEYGLHMPPTGNAPAGLLSGGNLSYKRWALELCADLIEAGAWEPVVNERLRKKGHELYRAGDAVVRYRNSLSASEFLRQRFHYGRWYAHVRREGAGWALRMVYAAFCPLLPPLLTFRLARVVFGRGRHRTAFVGALPWILFCQSVWSAGEFCGYLFGKGSSDKQVF